MATRERFRLSRVLAATLLAVAIGGALYAGTIPHTAPTVAEAEPTAPLERERHIVTHATVAVVGDSITAWDPPYGGDVAQSWVTTARSKQFEVVGGWAYPGARLAEMVANVTAPTVAPDVLVIMGGTNDLYYGTPVGDRLASIDQLVKIVGADRVVIAATPPYGFDYPLGAEWNETLAVHALHNGWAFVDPWGGYRTADGAWTDGASRADFVHPTPTTAAGVGVLLRDAVLATQ